MTIREYYLNDNGIIEEKELELPSVPANDESFVINKENEADKKNGELFLHDINIAENGLELSLSGEPAKMFMHLLMQFFKDNGGENYLTMEVHDHENKYEITIVNQNGNDTPSEKLQRQEVIIHNYENALQAIVGLDEKHVKDAVQIAKEALKHL